MMSEAQPELQRFLEHWEDMTGATAASGGQLVDYNKTDPSFLQSFFQASRSMAVPFSSTSLRAVDYTGHLNNIQKTLLVNTGNLV